MIHEYTTLPGHDPSKVRGYTAPDCISASASEALDVRVLKVAEEMAEDAAQLRMLKYNTWAYRVDRSAETLRAIAAEIRDAATPRRPVAVGAEIAEHLRWAADEISPWVVLTSDMQDRQRLIIKFLQALSLDVTGSTPKPVMDSSEPIATASTVTELRDAWAASAPPLDMEPIERIRLLEKAMGRLLVIEARHEGDGR